MKLQEIIDKYRDQIPKNIIEKSEEIMAWPIYKEYEIYMDTGIIGPISSCGCSKCKKDIKKMIKEVLNIQMLIMMSGIYC